MTTLVARRRRRTLAMLATTLSVLAAVPVLGYVGVRAVLDSTGGRDAGADNLPVQTFPATPSALYATTDDAGVLSSVTVFVLAPSGVGGSIISVPVNGDVGFANDARESLQATYAAGGAEALSFAIESLLIISVNFTTVNDPAQTATFLTPFEPYQVTLTNDVVTDVDGVSDTLNSGTVVIDAQNGSRVLTSGAGLGQESSRRANLEGFWAGFVTSIGGGRPPEVDPNDSVQPASYDQFITRLLAAPVQSRGLAVRTLEPEKNPTGIDVVEVNRSDAVFVFASIAPGSMGAPALGPSYRLEAPAGYDAQVQYTIRVILFLGGNVVSVDTTSPIRDETIFLVPDEVNRGRVAVTDEIFGDITFVEPIVRIAEVDVTIQLGTDYLESVEL